MDNHEQQHTVHFIHVDAFSGKKPLKYFINMDLLPAHPPHAAL